MESQMNINIPEDLSILCTIYQIKPETLVQLFVDKVSFPFYYSNTTGNDRWATLFFVNLLELHDSCYEVDEELEEQYLRTLTQTLLRLLEIDRKDVVKKEEEARKIMRQWYKAVLSKRAEYLTNNL